MKELSIYNKGLLGEVRLLDDSIGFPLPLSIDNHFKQVLVL